MMIFGNQSGQDVNALRELMRRGLLKESDLANLAVSESEPVRAPNALAQMMSAPPINTPLMNATAGQGFQGLSSGQGVVQATNADGTQGAPIRIDAGPPVAQGAPRDWSRVEVDTPNGRGYYGKDGKIYTPDGAVTTMQPVGTQARRNAEQDRLMKIAEMQARIAQIESATRENEAQTKLMAETKATPPIQVTDASGNVRLFDRNGNLLKNLGATGKPTATFEKTVAAKRQMATDIDTAIRELTEASKDGGWIDTSTGSGAGALVDAAAGFFGKATDGAVASGKLKPVADLVLKMIPRFEGPQSDKDTQSYRDASGDIANPATPNPIKKAAAKVILDLMTRRKGQFISAGNAGTEADAPSASSSGVRKYNPATGRIE